MSFLPFLHFFNFLVYCSLIIFILWEDRKSLLNRTCAAFLACFALWNYAFIFLHNPNTLEEVAILFNNLASIGWISFVSIFLWFSLIFTEKKKILKSKIFYLVIIFLPLLLIYKKWTGHLTADFIKLPWGWVRIWSNSIWTYLYYCYYLSFLMVALYLIYTFSRTSKNPLQKKQAKIIFITALTPIILGSLVDVFLPKMNIIQAPLALSPTLTLILAGGLAYAMNKYRLMVVTPVTAAENIISTMADSLVLLNREGKITITNQALTELSGYSKNELKGKSIELFFPENDFQIILLEKASKDEKFKNYELNFRTKKGDNIPVLLSSSTVKDDSGEIAGIVCIIKDIAERKKDEIKIAYEQSLLNALMNNISDSIYFKDKQAKFVKVNKAKALRLGVGPEEMIGKTDFDFFPTEVARSSFKDDMKVIESGKPIIGKEEEIVRLDKRKYWVSTTKVPWYDEKGKIIGIIGISRDITPQKEAIEALRKSQQEFASLFKSSSVALVYVDNDSYIIDVNTRFSELFGYTADEVRGKNINQGLIHPTDRIEEAQDLFQRSLSGNYYNYETIRKKKDGTCFPVSISCTIVFIDGKRKGRIISYADITEIKKVEKQLEKLARIDPLTGCYNRRYGLELLDRQLKLSNRNRTSILIGFLDIDNFKEINDNFGYQEGDRVLKEVANFFKSTLREVDIICRMGGDEFLLVFPENSLKEVHLIRNRLEEKLTQLNQNIEKNYQIQFSMGFSEYIPDEPKILDELVAIADQKMYKEKKGKKEVNLLNQSKR